MIDYCKKILGKFNYPGFIGTWLLFSCLDLFNGILLYAITFRGFALADTYRAILIDALLAAPTMFLNRKQYKFFAIPVFAILLLANMLNTFHILTYQSGISTYAIFAMIETTGPESLEFVLDQISIIKLLTIIASLTLPYLVFTKIIQRDTLIGKKSVTILGFILFIATLFVAQTAWDQGYRFLSSHPGYVTAWSLDRYGKEVQRAAHENTLPANIFGDLTTDDSPQTYVIIVGESANRNHMGIYGYSRNNTPFAKQDGWIQFNDVTSPATHTIPSLKHVLRFADLEQDGMQPSIIDLFNAAGFKTFWFSNQTAPKGSGNILESMTARASDQSYINLSRKEGKSTTYDGELIPHLDKALEDPAPKKVIFLHLLGSHLTYALRYPRKNTLFPLDSRKGLSLQDWHDDNALEHINHYDNSLAYTDLVLHQVLQTIKNAHTTSFVLYFSDHGQEVYDTRNMRGCSERNPTKHMVEVPMLLWLSPQYQKQHPQTVEYLKKAVDHPYSTQSLSGTIAQLASIKSTKLAVIHTLFSPEVDKDRTIHGHLYRDMAK